MMIRRHTFRFLALILPVSLLAACDNTPIPVAQTSPRNSVVGAPSVSTAASNAPGMPIPLADRSPLLMLATPPLQGTAVRELQKLLGGQGFDVGPVDGVFGERTERAVRDFQHSAGLAVDGVAGPRTWAALRFDAKGTTQQFLTEP